MRHEASSDGSEWLPVFLRLRGVRVLVAGGGIEARRKIERLLKHGAAVHVLGDVKDDTISALVASGRVRRVDALPNGRDSWRLIIVACRDDAMRSRTLEYARRWRIPVNAVDDPDHCTAILPAIVDRAPVTIAIGTGGAAPELARMIRSRIEAMLPQSLGALARLAAELKHRIRARFPDLPRRRQFLAWFFEGPVANAAHDDRSDDARRLAEQALDAPRFSPAGSVALVGAGPGDPELMTVKAMRLLQSADVVIHDALVETSVLDYARRDAEFLDVGKRGGRCSTPQHRIHELMRRHVEAGRRVVRLKGGDPMVFGRGGEELEFLRRSGIAYSVVPGVTAASGCATHAGIPLTHREYAHSVHLVTAHGRASIDRLDWPSLARERQTLAFYMAVSRLAEVQRNLVGHGMAPDVPIAIVENGARPEQRVLTGRIQYLHDIALEHSVQSPAMVYVGAVAALAAELHWYGEPPVVAHRPERPRVAMA